MKKSILKSFLLVSAGAFFLASTGCKKLEDFGDTNVDPNGSPVALTSALLSNAMNGLGGTVADLNTGHYAQIFAEPTYPGNSLYVLPQFDASGIYSGVLMDLQKMINQNTDPATATAAASDGPNANQIAIARILKAYYFWTITDRWGDIPYSEALKGSNFTPKYDEQEFIYKDLVKELTEAHAQFVEPVASVKGDLIYGPGIVNPATGGVYKADEQVANWKKLANSLRMLIALRTSEVYPAPGGWAATEFGAALATGNEHIDENSENFSLKYPDASGVYRNPFYQFSLSADNRTSKTLVDLMVGLSDPRGSAFYTSTNGGGTPYGLSTAAPTNVEYGKILNTQFHQQGSLLPIITASHVWLAKAEAYQRGWVAGDAKAAYDAGVTASFAQWGVTMPATYLTTGPANFNTGSGVSTIGGASVTGSNAITTTPLQRIHLQQFIAFYPNGIQTWSNWRRTGIPDIRPTVNARGGDGITRRYVYGQADQNLNPAQLAIAVARIPGGVDDQDAHVWWDQ